MSQRSMKRTDSSYAKPNTFENRSKLDKAADYVNYLQYPDLATNKLCLGLESLRNALTNNTLSWLNEFGEPGLKLLFSILGRHCGKQDSHKEDKIEKLLLECLRCLKAFMNNTLGLRLVLEQTDGMLWIAKCLNPDRPTVMVEALTILGVLCLVEYDRQTGHDKVLNAMTIVGEKMNQERFKPIINGLHRHNSNLSAACLQFINAVIDRTEDFDYRVHLRNEIVRVGLRDCIDKLRNSKEYAVQIQIFDNKCEADADELASRFDICI